MFLLNRIVMMVIHLTMMDVMRIVRERRDGSVQWLRREDQCVKDSVEMEF
jgi:hypothetical protein